MIGKRDWQTHLKMEQGEGKLEQKSKIYFFLLFFSPFSVFATSIHSNEIKFCDVLDPWKIQVCAVTDKEGALKSNHLHTHLKASLLRKKMVPKEVEEAGEAVFQIGIQYTFLDWNWNFNGGSGFFMFNERTFFTAYHVLEPLLNQVSDWNEIVFKDQNGNQREFTIKGMKFASLVHDIVVLEVEGYEGPVLELSKESLKEPSPSYIIGYSIRYLEGFKIQPVRSFEAADNHYGAFLELFDCYYGFNFTGSSGGPLLNREGKVQGVFTNLVNAPHSGCSFLLARKGDFLSEEAQSNKPINNTIEKAKDTLFSEQDKTMELAMNGDINALIELIFYNREIASTLLLDMEEILPSSNALIRHILMKLSLMDIESPDVINRTEMIDRKITSSQDTLSLTWYSKGVIAYYLEENLEKACGFWDKARQMGHPFVSSDFVIVPEEWDIISCKLD